MIVRVGMECEVCGKASTVHLTEIKFRLLFWFPVKREHHYCWEHSPPELGAKRPTQAEELKIVEQMIAQLDAREMNEAEKAKHREELKQLAEEIRAGRRRLGDAD